MKLNLKLAEAHRMARQAQQLHGADKILELRKAQRSKPIKNIIGNKKIKICGSFGCSAKFIVQTNVSIYMDDDFKK